MLLFYEKPMDDLKHDENPSRFPRLAALRSHFFAFKKMAGFRSAEQTQNKDTQTHAMAMSLKRGTTFDRLSGDPDILVINANGNAETFSGLGADVAACNSGLQGQHNTRLLPTFTPQLSMRPRERIPGIVLYGPRGILPHGDRTMEDSGNGQQTLRYGLVYVFDKIAGHRYPFDQGWVRAGY